MILVAIYNTILSMGPYYTTSTYKWFKSALWDAPMRLYLDIQLEYMRIERNLSELRKEEMHEE